MIQNPIPWPNGARCACAITFDMDADSLIHISRPKDSHDRLYPITMGRYGPTVGIPRILDTYARLGIKQSFFIPAWCIEQYPGAVDAILKGGHEIGHHGYIHEDPIETKGEAQEKAFLRALDIPLKRIGKKPRGYRAPVYNITQQVIDLLIAHGFKYESSLMADDIPDEILKNRDHSKAIPPLYGALLKNEQDVHLLERLAFMHRRETR